jgi:energy-coupling factor transporter ATP-binding protein EcfA2
MPALLVVRDLHKAYFAGLGRCRAQVQVLRGVSLSVGAGERLAVVGAPASGKTTLLHCVAGLRRPDAGHIRWARHAGERRARDICTRPSELLANHTDPLLVDLSEDQHHIVDWSECLRLRAAAGGGWILVARRLGPLTHLCDTVALLENGLLRPRTRAPVTRRVAEPVPRPS